MQKWFLMDKNQVCEKLNVDYKVGLNDNEVNKRKDKYGKNELKETNKRNPLKIFLAQFASTIVIVLLIAAVITAFIGEIKDTIVIAIILFLNAILGFSQEYKAERAMSALKKLSVPIVKVERNGETIEIPANELVPGDIVYLEAGNYVPADLRLISVSNLKIQESSLTGESEAVEKTEEVMSKKLIPLGDRKNMAYSGTVVTYGRGTGIVVETGMQTEIGKIATMIQNVNEEQTPLQKRLEKLGRTLAFASLGIVVIIFIMGLLRGEDLKLMFMTSVSFAVAAVPEGLPTVVTIALALGAQRMLKRNALVRKLMAVETLGSVNIICSDKTGTITENKMRVTVVELAGVKLDFGKENEPDPENIPEDDLGAMEVMLVGGSLCNDAEIQPPKTKKQEIDIIGDPTEGALLFAAERVKIKKDKCENAFPRVSEYPFDSNRKSMTTVHKIENTDNETISDVIQLIKDQGVDKLVCFTKGAVDRLIKISSKVLDGAEIKEMNEEMKNRIMNEHNLLAKNGMRILGIGFRPVNEEEIADDKLVQERNLIFLGMFGMMDPARVGVKEAVQTAKLAGIRPIMITGDHPLTAGYIAEKLGIIDSKDKVIQGNELDNMNEEEIIKTVNEISVYARVSPENKLTIVNALKKQGNVVAMTGDGVNDAPALKTADIGVAMGITGTDVSKEVSDIVLLDDNFSTIVKAVKEGRTIFDNIQKFIKYILASNIAEIWVMIIGPFIGMSLPLLPLQILWVNLVSDGLPALALSVEPPEKGIMKRPPNSTKTSILGTNWGILISIGFVISLFSLGSGFFLHEMENPAWRTLLFSTLVFSQLFFTLCIRTKESVFKESLLKNKAILIALSSGFLLQIMVIYIPFLQAAFGTVALSGLELLLSLGLGSAILWIYEIEKFFKRKKLKD